MNHPVLMCMLHGGAHLLKQLQAIPHSQLPAVAPCVDAHPFHVLQNQIGTAVVGGAAIQEPCDVDVVQICHNLALVAETLKDLVSAEVRTNELDRDSLAILAVGALGQVHGSHSA